MTLGCPTLHQLNTSPQIPPNLTFEQASTLPVTVGTAALGLYASKANNGLGLDAPWMEGGRGKYAGEPILVIGGASGVGQHGMSPPQFCFPCGVQC